jgi:hypothetical protein
MKEKISGKTGDKKAEKLPLKRTIEEQEIRCKRDI